MAELIPSIADSVGELLGPDEFLMYGCDFGDGVATPVVSVVDRSGVILFQSQGEDSLSAALAWLKERK